MKNSSPHSTTSQGKKETELYAPVKQLLESQGFCVRGEVHGCDLAALRDEELWVVEMKLHFNVKLLYQALDRLALTPCVFVAIPRPKRRSRAYRSAQLILKKLGLGLITVALDSPLRHAEVVLFPEGAKARSAPRRRQKLPDEMAGRSVDTPGGGTGKKINTAYRERCIKIACLLERHGDLSGKELVHQHSCEKDANPIMRNNHYGWFEKVALGRYALSEKGWQHLSENADDSLVAFYRCIMP